MNDPAKQSVLTVYLSGSHYLLATSLRSAAGVDKDAMVIEAQYHALGSCIQLQWIFSTCGYCTVLYSLCNEYDVCDIRYRLTRASPALKVQWTEQKPHAAEQKPPTAEVRYSTVLYYRTMSARHSPFYCLYCF